MPNIWFVEDDEDIREIAIYALRTAGHEATGFENGMDFFTRLDNNATNSDAPDLVILDIMLPGEDGLSILKKLRANHHTRDLPVIMLTAKGSEHDKVKGLDQGADDYLTKPFGVMELISRIKALLRRSQRNPSTQIFRFHEIHMNHAQRVVSAFDQPVTLTFKEYELLHYLLINVNLVLNREKILEAVWGYDYEGESRTLDMHIKSLRQKLHEAGSYIKTVRNVGYKLGE